MTKKFSRREMLKYSTGLVAGAVLASCTPAPTKTPEVQAVAPSAPEGNVVVMHFRGEFNEDQMNAFMAEHPGITLEFVAGEELTRFFAMMAAGTPPDLLRVQAPSIPQFLARKLLYDLTPYFEASSLLKIDDLLPANNYYRAESPLKIGTGKLYGMVKDFSPDLTMYAYDKAFTDVGLEAPDDTKALTFAELKDLSKKITKKEGDRVLMFGYGFEGAWIDRFWQVALGESGQSLYSEGYDKMNLTGNEEAKKIAQWYFDMAKEGLTFSPLNPSPAGWFGTDFQAGQLAFAQYGFWYSAMAEADTNRGSIRMLPAPTWSGKRQNPTITATGMIMTSATQVPDAAWLAFEYYNGGQPAIDRAKSGWGVPGLKSLLPLIPQETDFQKQANRVLQGELALENLTVQFNPFLGEAAVSSAWGKYLEVALKGEIDFDTMLKNVEDEVNVTIKDGISAILG